MQTIPSWAIQENPVPNLGAATAAIHAQDGTVTAPFTGCPDQEFEPVVAHCPYHVDRDQAEAPPEPTLEEQLYLQYFLRVRYDELALAKKEKRYPPCIKFQESQFRDWPGTFLREEFDGFLPNPVPNCHKQ